MGNETTEKRYPLQTYKVKRTTKTFGIDFYLFSPEENDNSCSPLELHNGFSRFLFTIVDKSTPNNIITPKANIPARDIACILMKTQIAMQSYLLSSAKPVQSADCGVAGTGLAFTQKLFFNTHKGKTPAEILMENPEEKEALLKMRGMLQMNLDKYPKNKDQIAAIDEAIQLLEIGELQGGAPTEPVSSSVITLYKTEYKHMSQKNEQGNTLVYAISIVFDGSKNYPFIIEISNCFAPIEVAPNGQHRPQMAKATHMAKSSISLTDSESVGLITHLSDIKGYFELTSFKPLLTIAKNNAYQPK